MEMTLTNAIETMKILGLIGNETTVCIIVNNGYTESTVMKKFEVELSAKDALEYFGDHRFITSWTKTGGDTFKWVEIVFLVTKGKEK